MTDRPFEDRANLPPAERLALERLVRGHQGLDDVLAWASEGDPRPAPADVVTMDEYTHDVVVGLAGDRFLVYDTT